MDFLIEKNRISLNDKDGRLVAEVNHPFVDESLRGQGIADKLLTTAADILREEHKKAYPTCSFAVKWFERHSDYADILADNPES